MNKQNLIKREMTQEEVKEEEDRYHEYKFGGQYTKYNPRPDSPIIVRPYENEELIHTTYQNGPRSFL